MGLRRFYKGVMPSVMPSKRSQWVKNLAWAPSRVTVGLVPEKLCSGSTGLGVRPQLAPHITRFLESNWPFAYFF